MNRLVLENEAIRIRYADERRQVEITDKRIGKIWLHRPFPDSLGSIAVHRQENAILFRFESLPGVSLRAAQDRGAEIVYTVQGDSALPMEEIALPTAIEPNDGRHFVLETDSEGMLLPVKDQDYPVGKLPLFYCGGGPCMAWKGMVDGSLRSGYMQIYETPYDVYVDTDRKNGLISFAPVWRSEKGVLGYERTVRFVFFDQGGYAAQCKRYRAFSWPAFQAVSLKEKAKAFPALKKMLGCVHMYVWDDARTAAFLQDLKRSGVSRALLLWDPNHPPYPDESYVDTAAALGYAAGNYTLFTDIHPDDPSRLAKLERLPFLGSVYPGKFEELTAKPREGGTYSNVFGHYVCPAAVREEIKKRLDGMCARFRDETFFLDVYLANGLYECYDPRHPLTREGYAKAILANMRFIQENYGVCLGSEFGADFGAGAAAYVHGMMTLQRTWFDSITTVPGSIYYTGDWKNPARPSAMLGIRTASPDYHRYSINAALRVPLYELVYHDAVVSSWRWEDCNHHNPEIWWKKDLFNMLYGTTPLWSLDHGRFTEFKTTFVESFQKVTPWLSDICCDELISHRFVTEERLVQESVFSSGRRILVNFGDRDARCGQATVPARDAATF